MNTNNKGGTALKALAGIAGALAVVGVIAVIKVSQIATISEAFAAQVPPAERVNAFAVEQQHWAPRVSSVGSVVAVQGTAVSAEADGVVRAILFEPGSTVEAGAPLVLLDDEVEQSQLRSAQAAAEVALLQYERAKRLIGERAISQADFDTAEANWKQAEAHVDNLRALIAKKAVRAPFSGRIGIRRVSVGEFLAKGTPVASLQSLDPVYVEFSLPQQRLGELREGLAVDVRADAFPDRTFTGEVTAVEPHVDPATRNVRVQATFANADGALRPGMFVSVDVILGAARPVNVIPATAVAHSPLGDSVYVIEAAAEQPGGQALVVRQQPVRLGPRRGDFVAVTDGLETGDRVVATGVFKLRPGTPVVVDNTLRPEFAVAPAPGNG
ncbi:MAG TPA: efflux RND transporter periplasmic adaptor subunit [Gammaproteobacteria bacterium]